MKRTFKKSLALFLSAALLLSNSLVTSADNYEPTTSVEDTGGTENIDSASADATETGPDDNKSTGTTIGDDVQEENSSNETTEDETLTDVTETEEGEEELTGTGSDSDVREEEDESDQTEDGTLSDESDEDVTVSEDGNETDESQEHAEGKENDESEEAQEVPDNSKDETEASSEEGGTSSSEPNEALDEQETESSVEETIEEETEAEPVEEEEFFYSETIGDVTITLSAKAGVLPEGTTASIDAVLLSEAEGVPEEILEQYTDDYIYDITLYDDEGEELSNDWSENGTVKVTFSGAKIEEMSEANGEVDVLHIEKSEDGDEATVEIVEKDVAAGDEITVESEHFSYYAPMLRNDAMTLAELPEGINEEDIVRTYEVYPGETVEINSDDEPYRGEWSLYDKYPDSVIELDESYNWYGKCAKVSIKENALPGDIFYVKHEWNEGIIRPKTYREFFKIEVLKEGTSPAYFYIKKDPTIKDSTSSSDYLYWGKGFIPMGPAEDYKIDHERVPDDWDLEPPVPKFDGYDNYDSDGYPILTSDGESYYYKFSNAVEKNGNYYTIEWNTYTVAVGAVGPDGKDIVDTTTWHIDGDVFLYGDSIVSVNPYVQDKESWGDTPTFYNEDEGLNQVYIIYADEDKEKAAYEIYRMLKAYFGSDELSVLIDDADRQGYEFGWYLDSNGMDPITSVEDIVSNIDDGQITVYGIYREAKEYVDITFKVDDETHGILANKDNIEDKRSEFTITAEIGKKFSEAGVNIPEPIGRTDAYGTKWVFDHWEPDVSSGTTVVADPSGNVYTAVFSEDKNGDGQADSKQLAIVFDLGTESDTTFNADAADKLNGVISADSRTLTAYVTVKDGAVYPVAPSADDMTDAMTDKLAFDGWVSSTDESEYQEGAPIDGSLKGKTVTFNASYLTDNDQNGKPDKDQVHDITYATGLDAGIKVENMPENTEAAYGETVTINGTPDADYYVFKGWKFDDVQISGNTFTMPNKAVIITAEWYDDTDNDGNADKDEVNITFESEYGFDNDPAKTVESTLQVPGETIAAPQPNDTDHDGVVWTGWTDGTNTYTKDQFKTREVPGEATTYTAVYKDDVNNNSQPDDEESSTASIAPYDTTIYVGGTNDYGEAGLPNLELELRTESEERPVNEANVKSIYINGVEQPVDADHNISTYLRAVYVDPDTGAVVEDDAQHNVVNSAGVYNIEVALTSAVVTENEASGIAKFAGAEAEAESDNGYLVGEDRKPVLARNSTIVINDNKISFGDSSEDSADLIVRSVSDTEAARRGEIYRAIYTKGGTVAEGRAIAVVDPGTTFYVNDDTDRALDADEAQGIVLLVDDVLAPTEGDEAERSALLKEKANSVLPELSGMTAEEAEAAGYHYVLRYMDLVDPNNGNAWVSSTKGTDVYVPYQTEAGADTEYRIIHFEDLHREYGLTGPDVITAINDGNAVVMDIENTPYGIKFHTDQSGFSPFAIIWNENGNFDGSTDDPDTPVTPEEPDSGDDDDPENGSGSGSGSGSGGHNESDRNSIGGTYYTVGVNGNWRHMDNVDVNAPLDEAVPDGATAMAAPEWHRWKFFRNDGSNIRSQWAHIANPYAVDDQPKTGWFYFDAEGLMQYGWFLDTTTGKWYYLHAESDGMLGTMVTGWHYDLNDGRWYYLDPATGEMLLGWQNIGGKWYYFNTAPNEQTWNLDSLAGLWRFNNSTARPLGSMYINEKTPDGYQVDGSGAWIQ